MPSAQKFEFDHILEDQDRLHRLMTSLDHRIDVLARNINVAPERKNPKPVEVARPREEPVPPPLPVVCPPPKPIRETQTPQPRYAHAPEPKPSTLAAPLLPPPEKVDAPANEEPLELRVGTYWMSRIGIVILLTGLVFLGNYAYHRIVPLLGPWAKISFLMVAGLSLGGTGYWMERGKESLKNFGRVLFAGGAATIYYTTYAAHFVQGLRVIESPLIGGLMLLAVAGGIAWYAERKRSETIASIAVLLSFYTSAINSIAGFTLFSSLLLTSVAIYFLLRHRWSRLSSISLFATYGSYAFWRFHQLAESSSAASPGMGVTFLAAYWILFTTGILFAVRETFRSIDRTAFLSLNNIAFFAFAAHSFAAHLPGGFWMFAIGFGGVLLALAAFAAYRDEESSAVDGAYLAQGLIAITVGLAARFSGPQLAMILALESSALLSCVRRRHGLLYEIAAGLCALVAFVLALYQVQLVGTGPWSVGAPIAALFIFNAWWIKHLRREPEDRLISARSIAFAVPALILLGNVVWQITPEATRPAAFAILALIGLPAFRIRLAEVGLTAQLFVPLAALLVFFQSTTSVAYPWWTLALVTLSSLALVHFWQLCREEFWKDASVAMQLAFAIVAVATGICWMSSFLQGGVWLVATSIAAVGVVVYGLITRAWTIALIGQLFAILTVGAFALDLAFSRYEWSTALTPVIAMAIIAAAVSHWAPHRWPAFSEPTTYSKLAGYYRVAAAVLFAAWAFQHIPFQLRIAFFAVGGALQIFAGSIMRAPARIVSGTLYAIGAVLLFWIRFDQPVIWFDVLALISIPLSLRLSTRLTGESPLPNDLRNCLVALVLGSVWLWVTRWTLEIGAPGQLTTSWTVLSLLVFAAGLTLRERIYRLGGFTILGLALGRLFLFDVWKFDSLFRIISFLVLGAALLALSFVYHRFSEAFRKYL